MRSEGLAARLLAGLVYSAFMLMTVPASADAQGTTATDGGAAFLPRAAFSFGWGSLITDDRRFDWQGRVGVDFDVMTARSWRVSFRGDYEAILGRERRRYDLNQSNYFFEAALGRRLRGVELQAIVQHVSRHVVDRENTPAISWNLAGARARSSLTLRGDRRLDGEIDTGGFTQPAFVDYRWATRAAASYREPLSTRLSFIGRASGEVVNVRREIYGRPRICGGRIEVALRVRGRAASFEAFAGYERRIDAFPTDRFRVRWITVGFRVVQ